MAAPPLAIKLRCTSWEQLARLHERDLARGALFLKSQKPPPIGTEMRIDLTIPSGTTITLEGRVARLVTAGDRGAGVDLMLAKIPASDRWVIESALASAGFPVKSHEAPQPPKASKPAGAPVAGDLPVDIPIEVDDPVEEPEAAAAEFDLVQALEAELAGLRAMNPFQVLGVTYETDDGGVRAAFNELTKKYHPDRFARYESETARALAGEIFILVREAYRRLGDAQARAGARAAMKGQPPPSGARGAGRAMTPVAGVPVRAAPPAPGAGAPMPPPLPAPPQARPTPPGGRAAPPGAKAATPPPLQAAARATPPAQPPPLAAPAQPSFEPEKVLSFRSTGNVPVVAGPAARPGGANSVPLDDESLFGDLGGGDAGAGGASAAPPRESQPLVSPFFARGETMLEAGHYDDAFQAFDAAARSNPGDRAARVGRELARGFQKLAEGDRIAAAQCFEAALEIDPMNERAARELSAMRRAATDARRGLLGKLLGKRS